jgi:sugar lactone lactonase YvrE
LEDGSTDAWNPLFGSWFMANENMEAALSFSGYDVQHAWGIHGHDGSPGNVIFPDVMRWLWRGWPAPVQAGVSQNDMLGSILRRGEGWERVEGTYGAVSALAANSSGDIYFMDATRHAIDRVGPDGQVSVFQAYSPDLAGAAFGPDGSLYATVPSRHEVVAFDRAGTMRGVAADIRGNRILVNAAGEIYITEPGMHADEPGVIWRIGKDAARTPLDPNLAAVSGIAISPDATLFYAAQRTQPRVTSYVIGAEGSLNDREANYWLHPAAVPADPGAADLAVDVQGSLYVATPLGVQVCDRNGRVRAILWIPSPSGPVESLCWGGEGFATLYATDGRTLFRRMLAVAGFEPWAPPAVLPKANAG